MTDKAEEICNCGTFEEAIASAKDAIEEAYLANGDNHMCLMFQMMVTQAIGAICLRGLHMQLDEVCKKAGEERSQKETRDAVLKAMHVLQGKLGNHIVEHGSELDKYLVDLLARRGHNPFVLSEEEHSVH